MKISVITWDGNFRGYTHTIDFFAQQEFAQGDFEFIWVDFYKSNDRVRQKIEKYPNAQLLILDNPPDTPWHLGKCINAGVKFSSGDLLVIPDGDIVVEQDFLAYVLQAQQKYKDLVLYFRRYDEPEHASSSQSQKSLLHLKQYAKLTNPRNYGGCLTLRRDNFEKIRGYETHEVFSGPGCQGLETYTRLNNAGMAIKWAPDKNIFHPWHPLSSSPVHNDRKALCLARNKYPWIIPYSGLKQSWIVHCREISGDTFSSKDACEECLACMPQIHMDFYKKRVRRFIPGFLNRLRSIKLLKAFLKARLYA